MTRSAASRRVAWQGELLHVAVLVMETVWCIPLFIAVAPGANLLPTGDAAFVVIANLAVSMGRAGGRCAVQCADAGPDSASQWYR
jgi:hypothetical protein